MRDLGVRAMVVREPWMNRYKLVIGNSTFRATGVEGGNIVYEQCEPGAEHKPLLELSREEVDAIAKAFLAEERPEDATLDALKDARSVRDRLLSMLEQRGIR